MKCSTVNYTQHIVYQIPRTYYFCNWKFQPFDQHPIISPTLQLLVTTIPLSEFYEFNDFRLHI